MLEYWVNLKKRILQAYDDAPLEVFILLELGKVAAAVCFLLFWPVFVFGENIVLILTTYVCYLVFAVGALFVKDYKRFKKSASYVDEKKVASE